MAEQLDDHREAFANQQAAGSEGVPKIVNADIIEACRLTNAPSWSLEIGQMRALELAEQLGHVCRTDSAGALIAEEGVDEEFNRAFVFGLRGWLASGSYVFGEKAPAQFLNGAGLTFLVADGGRVAIVTAHIAEHAGRLLAGDLDSDWAELAGSSPSGCGHADDTGLGKNVCHSA